MRVPAEVTGQLEPTPAALIPVAARERSVPGSDVGDREMQPFHILPEQLAPKDLEPQ